MGQGAAAPRPLARSCGKGRAPVRSAAPFVWDGVKGEQLGWGEGEPRRVRARVWRDLCAALLPRALFFACSIGLVL